MLQSKLLKGWCASSSSSRTEVRRLATLVRKSLSLNCDRPFESVCFLKCTQGTIHRMLRWRPSSTEGSASNFAGSTIEDFFQFGSSPICGLLEKPTIFTGSFSLFVANSCWLPCSKVCFLLFSDIRIVIIMLGMS